ncbi:protein translocase subunit SecF [Candidatus Woesearchaeota archaeon]|nr:protein translocase subunit SecF [Candidatus Woesearchaeota archaeon]
MSEEHSEHKEEHKEHEEYKEEKKKFSFREFYEKNYKKLLMIPVILLILAVLQIALQAAVTGDFMHKGVSLKGGITISIEKALDTKELNDFLNEKFPKADVLVRALSRGGTQFGVIIEASDVESEQLISVIEEKTGELESGEYNVEVMGSSLGASFFSETIRAVIIAFIFMGIVVFIYFRIPIPSLAVILAAFSDIIVTLAVANIIGIKISTAGIAAFLMLIGYSVDTNILLSTKMLKKKEGTSYDAYIGAAKTGLTMSITTISAITVALIFAQSEILRQIMTILLIGLFADIINTWLQNAGILKWFLMRKHKHVED